MELKGSKILIFVRRKWKYQIHLDIGELRM